MRKLATVLRDEQRKIYAFVIMRKKNLSHYSNATTDFEYKFPFGWGELWGIASRTDYDLKQHMEFSGEDFHYLDPETNEKYIPYCIEPSLVQTG